MRYFNTAGPCRPEEHYTVMRERLIADGKNKVKKGCYFTISAPRQTGKTTYFQLLFRELSEDYTRIWISFENLKTAEKDLFYKDLSYQLHQELSAQSIRIDCTVRDQVEVQKFFDRLRDQAKPVFLVIDEFEGIPEPVLSELMHTFRKMYHRRQYHGLHSLALVGVSTLAELVLLSASPFNIADQIAIPYFTLEEVKDLTGQYAAESGQNFEEKVVKEIFGNTGGQPGLVCSLCRHLTEDIVRDRTKQIRLEDFHETLRHFLTRRADMNILNIVHKAREKRNLMLRLLFREDPIPFSVHDPDIAYLSAHGLIADSDGYAGISAPLYGKVLIAAFRPLFNGESEHYVGVQDSFGEYLTVSGLDMRAVLKRYSDYVARRGFRAFDTEHLKEAAWHYSLDGFINFFIERLGGQTFIEVPSGRGRTDILILFGNRKYVVETKIFTDKYYFEKGKRQLAAYLATEELSEGYYVVFSNRHKENDRLCFEEDIQGKRIITYIIRTNYEQASRTG